MSTHTFFQIRSSKDDESTPESAQNVFASLVPSSTTLLKRLVFGAPKPYCFEIYLLGQTVYFYAVAPKGRETLMKSLLQSSYPSSSLITTTDPLDIVTKSKILLPAELVLTKKYSLPLRTYKDLGEIDSLSSLLGFLSKQSGDVRIAIQIAIAPASFSWQKAAQSSAKTTSTDPTTGKQVTKSSDNQALIAQKIQYPGCKVTMRVLLGTDVPGLGSEYLASVMSGITSSYGSLASGEGNGLKGRRILATKGAFVKRLKERRVGYFERGDQILNAAELATLWHPTGIKLAGIKNITWGKQLSGEPPQTLPVVTMMDEETKKKTNFFAKTEYKNQETIFGIKEVDRRRHMYIIGKTGAGKSTLIANMAIDDIRRDRGIGVIDPHGDLAETILKYIPKRRLNDVVYLEPFDTERPFSLNVLEVRHKQHRDLVSSGIVAIFGKLYADSWGPRLEYILRNTILTLLELPHATLPDALRLLGDKKWRDRQLEKVTDEVLLQFWKKEFDAYTDKLRTEAISPIQNKIGQFVQSKMVRNIIGSNKSTIDLQSIMDEGKILILNLSQGKLGEDNAALLGAMVITQIQLAAMNRAFIKEEDRKDFFLYVDEFQNFATTSFIKILSEARKYRLALTLTNQYIEQLTEDIQRAIFGNVGTLISFVMGSRDAEIFSKEYAGLYSPADMVNLGKHQIVLKLCIDNMTSTPFPAKTLPLPSMRNENTDKIVRMSKERYGRKVEEYKVSSEDDEPQQTAVSEPRRDGGATAPRPADSHDRRPKSRPRAPKPPNTPHRSHADQAPPPKHAVTHVTAKASVTPAAPISPSEDTSST